jgi:hypothetical protein
MTEEEIEVIKDHTEAMKELAKELYDHTLALEAHTNALVHA